MSPVSVRSSALLASPEPGRGGGAGRPPAPMPHQQQRAAAARVTVPLGWGSMWRAASCLCVGVMGSGRPGWSQRVGGGGPAQGAAGGGQVGPARGRPQPAIAHKQRWRWAAARSCCWRGWESQMTGRGWGGVGGQGGLGTSLGGTRMTCRQSGQGTLQPWCLIIAQNRHLLFGVLGATDSLGGLCWGFLPRAAAGVCVSSCGLPFRAPPAKMPSELQARPTTGPWLPGSGPPPRPPASYEGPRQALQRQEERPAAPSASSGLLLCLLAAVGTDDWVSGQRHCHAVPCPGGR